MIEEVTKQVEKLLNQENSGHGMEHIHRVLNLSLKFAEKENADKEVVALIALLHDVDDYKLFGTASAKHLTNAKNILDSISISSNIKDQVLNAISTIGFSKSLEGIRPTTLEGKIVSDADMCDAMGVAGILRSYQYNLAHHNPFFDKNVFRSLNMSAEEYRAKKGGTVITHLFEKILKLKNMMLTDSGKKEAIERHHIMIDFLHHFFLEENALEWIDYLHNYLNENNLL